jgi:hypothetical protein
MVQDTSVFTAVNKFNDRRIRLFSFLVQDATLDVAKVGGLLIVTGLAW